MSRFISSTLCLILLFGLTSTAHAQQENEDTLPGPAAAGAGKDTSLQSCFDYYRFGSVPVVLSTDTVRLAQGAEMVISGKVINQNDYRVDDITVYGKVYYKKNFDKSSFGPDIIQMMPLAEDITLEAGEEKTFTYQWTVPTNAQPGNYQIASFVVSHDRFNMAGLSFTSDVVGHLLNFNIAGEELGAVRFDNTQVVLNDVPFHGAIFPPKSETPEEGVPISAIIENTTNKNFSGTVEWKVYSWDSMNEQNLIEEATTEVNIGSQASSSVAYTILDSNHTVYYVLGSLIPDGSDTPVSILQARYVQVGADAPNEARIGFLGVSDYPSAKDQTSAFVCVHATGSRSVNDSKLVLTAKPLDPVSRFLNLNNIGTLTYEGDIPGAMSAIAMPFTDDSKDFEVTATLYQSGELVDSVTIAYRCEDYYSEGCGSQAKNMIILGAIAAGILIILLITLVLVRKRKKIKEDITSDSLL